MIPVSVDGRSIQSPQGISVLAACLAADIYIPHLCWLDDDAPEAAPAACRLCFVEIDGLKQPVAACTIIVQPGMTIRTDTDAVRHLQRTALKLLLSVHRVACKHCPANKACALQDVAKFLGVGLTCKPFDKVLKEPEIDSNHPLFDYYSNRCVCCGICVRVCRRQNAEHRLSFAGRGFDTVVGYFEADSGGSLSCARCRACLEACPTGALVERSTEEA